MQFDKIIYPEEQSAKKSGKKHLEKIVFHDNLPKKVYDTTICKNLKKCLMEQRFSKKLFRISICKEAALKRN